jgi:hypothetical protein
MLIQLLEKHGLGGRVEANAAVSSSNIVRLNSAGVTVVCLSNLDLGSSPAHLRHSIQRIRQQIANAKLVAGLWGHAEDENREQRPLTAARGLLCVLAQGSGESLHRSGFTWLDEAPGNARPSSHSRIG